MLRAIQSNIRAAVFTLACAIGLSACHSSSDDGGSSSAVAPTSFTLYAGIQANDGHSYVQVLTFNSLTNQFVVPASSQIAVDGAAIPGNSIRTIGEIVGGNLLLGGGSAQTRLFNLSTHAVTDSISLGTLSDISGSCFLPNGHILGSNYGTGSASNVYEYDATGAQLRTVVTLARAMFDCHALSSTSVYLVDYNANSDNFASVNKLVYNGTSWNTTDSFDTTTLVAGNSRYSLVVHTNGKIYLPPQNPEAALGTRQMMVCSQSNLAGSCALTGNDIANGTGLASSGDNDTPQGAVQIPGSDDLLILSSQLTTNGFVLLRYNVTTGVYTVMTKVSGVLPTNIAPNGIRGLRIRTN